MKRYKQKGNDCLRTCIACLIEVEPEEIVDFKELFFAGEFNGVPKWHIELENWLNERGLTRRLATKEEIESNEPLIAIGLAADTGVMHAEIYSNGKLLYDPSGMNKKLLGVQAYQKIDKYERAE